MSETMKAGVRQLQRERRRRLAEALSVLSPTAPETMLPEDPEDSVLGLRLLDMHPVAPQSWINTALCIMVYRDDDIPEEVYVMHVLDATVAEHADILERQKVTRCRLYNLTYPEHFFWRYFDEKIKLQRTGFTEDEFEINALALNCI